MAFKGYASGGSKSTYNILPIDAEINEDLRIAGGKVRDIQLTAQRKQQHTQEYIGALNHKFEVEQKNRDDNDKWFQSNFKRIYEGEQKEFDAKMAELKQEQAIARQKGSEPSVLEKALPHILSLVKVGAGMIAETAAAEKAGAAEIIQNSFDTFDGAGLKISAIDKYNASVKKYQLEGLTKSASMKRALKESPKVAELHKENPNLLRDFNNAIGINPDAAAIARAQAYGSELRNRINFERTKPDSNWSLAAQGGAGNYTETLQIGKDTVTETLYRIADEADPSGAGKEAIRELYKNPTARQILAKTKQDILSGFNKEAHKNITAANLQEHEETHLTHLGNILRSDGVDKFVESAGILYREEKPNGNKLGEADYLINAIEKLGLSPADAAQVRAAFQKGHSSVIHDESVMGQKWLDLDKRLGDAVSGRFRTQQNMKSIEEHKMLQEFVVMKPGEQRAWYDGSLKSGQFQTLGDPTKRTILSALSRQGATAAQKQAANPLSQISTTGKKEMATTVITKNLRALGNNQTTLVIGADVIDEVTSDANRHFLNFYSQNKTAVERDPTTYYKLALKEALKEQEWSVEGTKAKGIVGLTSRPSPLADQDESVQRDQLRNVKNGDYGDVFEVNHGFRTRIENAKEALRSMDINTLTPQQIEHHLYSDDVTRALDIARQKDRFATRGSVFQDMLNSVDGPNVDISHVITSRDQAKKAYEMGFNGRDSTVSDGVHRGDPISNSAFVRREGTLQPGDHFEHGTQGIKTPQGVFANREIAGYATSIAKAYPNMTWTSTQRTKAYQEHIRRTQGVNPSDTSNHLKGISFDAVGKDAQRLKQDIDSGKVKGVSYHIEPGYSHVHFDITGPVSIAGQKAEPKPEPLVVQPPAEGITDANNNSIVIPTPGDTANYGRPGLVPPDKRIPTGVNRVAAGIGDAFFNAVLPGNPLDLDKRGN